MSRHDLIKAIAQSIPKRRREKLRVAVLVSGNGSNLQALIDYSKRFDSRFEITLVVGNNKESLAYKRASAAFIENHCVDHRQFPKKSLFEERILVHLHEANIDLVVLAGFLRVLSRSFLERYPNRIINLHPSLLPRHPGLHAIQKALDARDDIAGCTVHLVDEGLDTGPIIDQQSCLVRLEDDLTTLTKKIQTLEHALLPGIVQDIATQVLKRPFTDFA